MSAFEESFQRFFADAESAADLSRFEVASLDRR
jgi:hypothetical protein